jgi:hypothetical protein
MMASLDASADSWKMRLGIAALALMLAATAAAHPADISYLRVRTERQKLELRFTFNLLMLTRFVRVDANEDRRIDKAELDAAQPALRTYLAEHIQVRINDQPAVLGDAAPVVCLWPSPDTPHQAMEEEWPQRHVDLVFIQEVKPVLEDIWLGFEIWEQTGPLGTVEATYEQEQTRTQVPFSPNEPDYLYDTGYLAADAPLAFDPFAPAEVAGSSVPHRLILAAATLACLAVLGIGWRRWRRIATR